MNYVDFTAGGHDYKLRLSIRSIIGLEKLLGCNPLSIFGTGDKIPTVTAMVQILHAALQEYHHNISMNDAFSIYEAYLNDGNSMTDFVVVIVNIYKASGLIQEEGAAKN